MALRRWLAPGVMTLVLIVLVVLMVVLAVPTTGLAMSFEHYVHYFPAWDHILKPLVDQCPDELANYRDLFQAQPRLGYRILDCVMTNFDEYRKSEMASASVILGLAPGLLQQLSPTYADTAVIATRRPLLALLIAGGSPAVRLMEASNHGDLVKKLKETPVWTFSENWGYAGLLSVAEYVLALAAIANNGQLAYELGVWAVCGFSPSQTTLPALWCVSAVVVHLVGWQAMRTRLKLVVKRKGSHGGKKAGVLATWLKAEATPLRYASRTHLEGEAESPVFLALASLLYVGTAVQTLYGTLIMSSLVFIGVGDATVVVLRYFASTLACRLLVICELSGIRPVEEGSAYDGLPQEWQEGAEGVPAQAVISDVSRQKTAVRP